MTLKLPASLVDQVVTAVSKSTGIPCEAIMSRRLTRPVLYARQHAMHTLRSLKQPNGKPRFGLEQIARAFNCDRATARYGVQAHEDRFAVQTDRVAA